MMFTNASKQQYNQEEMTDSNFTTLFYELHQSKKTGKLVPTPPDFDHTEAVWMSIYGLGKFETYSFLYANCNDINHFKEWLVKLKGQDFIENADLKFKTWQQNQSIEKKKADLFPRKLSPEQLQFWEDNGYLRISKVVEDIHCDNVKQRICRHLNLNMEYPVTWYTEHPDWHGLMLQVYQDENMEAIRNHDKIREVFEELFQTQRIVPTMEKLSYNPPEVPGWVFRHGDLHMDLDLDNPVEFDIQGLVYLDDVPEDRGPIHVVPGFHNRFEEWIKDFSSLERAHISMRLTERGQPVPGEKGDLILWRNTLPHAAGSNRSNLPRFVQYVSFTKL